MSDQPLPFEAYKGKEPYIFISYAHKDSAVVFQELVRIRSWGLNVWYDEGIDPGSEWPDEIATALKNCTLFLYFVTPRAVASVNCRNEVYYALNYKKPFLSIYLEKTDIGAINPGLELSIGSLQAILKFQMDELSYTRKLSKALGKPLPLGELKPDEGTLEAKGLAESPVVLSSPPPVTGPAPGSLPAPAARSFPTAPSVPKSSGTGMLIVILLLLLILMGGSLAAVGVFLYLNYPSSTDKSKPIVAPTLNPSPPPIQPILIPSPAPQPTPTPPPLAKGVMTFLSPAGGHFIIFFNGADVKEGPIPSNVTDLKAGVYGVELSSEGVGFQFPVVINGKDTVNVPDPASLAAIADKTKDPVDEYNAGFCYYMGWGVAKDHAQAVPWFVKAGNQNNIGAEICLGYLYHIGSGVPQDDATALIWYRKAADTGSLGAQLSAGLISLANKDYDHALKYLKLAADQGNVMAQRNVGIMYYQGQGGPADYPQADHYLQLADAQGDSEAPVVLGQMAYFAKGEPQDVEKAKAYWKKAAERGNQRAVNMLKVLGGKGV